MGDDASMKIQHIKPEHVDAVVEMAGKFTVASGYGEYCEYDPEALRVIANACLDADDKTILIATDEAGQAQAMQTWFLWAMDSLSIQSFVRLRGANQSIGFCPES